MPDRSTLRLASSLLLGGFLTYVVVTLLHTGGPANDHPVIFDDYAGSHDWAAVHLGQFLGMALLVAGLMTLTRALNLASGPAAWLARAGSALSTIALGLYGALQAVDGVALKQAVDAWVSAPTAEKAARFANAETVRWLEWGMRSYHSTALGLALLLIGAAVAATARVPRTIGALMVLSGIAYLAQGWVLGSHGFSDEDSTAIIAGYLPTLIWSVSLAVYAWRSPRSAPHSSTPANAPEGAAR